MAGPPDVKNLYSVKIDNVNYDSRDFLDVRNELKDAFSKYGEVGDVHLPRDKNFCFVRFTEERDAEEAVEKMDGRRMFGDEIKCMLATQPKRSSEEMRERDDGRGGSRDRGGRGDR